MPKKTVSRKLCSPTAFHPSRSSKKREPQSPPPAVLCSTRRTVLKAPAPRKLMDFRSERVTLEGGGKTKEAGRSWAFLWKENIKALIIQSKSLKFLGLKSLAVAQKLTADDSKTHGKSQENHLLLDAPHSLLEAMKSLAPNYLPPAVDQGRVAPASWMLIRYSKSLLIFSVMICLCHAKTQTSQQQKTKELA